ncbi:hypothetical protein CMK18_07775 [Candidatus Poribacteria bacterium]|nr:hypothetical protein [Candidatus Poribacteria bacterium]
MNEKKRFKTKIDWWLAILLCVSPLISLLTLLGFYLLGISYAWLSWLVVLIVGLIYAGLIFPLYYELEDNNLLIRFGRIRSRIPYQRIKKVIPTRSTSSSPALSLDRLYIDTGDDLAVSISPTNKIRFLQALEEKANHLVLIDNQLVSKNEL